MNKAKVTHKTRSSEGLTTVTASSALGYMPCPFCGDKGKSYRHMTRKRVLRDLGTDGPVRVVLEYSYHRCRECGQFFSSSQAPYAEKVDRSKYTIAVRKEAAALRRKGYTLGMIREELRQKHHLEAPESSIHEWLYAYESADS